MNYTWELYSESGNHPKNDDAVIVQESADALLFAVADGVGSSRHGKDASALTAELLRQRFQAEGAELDLAAAVNDANRLLLEKNQATEGGFETTVAAALVTPGKVRLLHVGDSRIYLFANGERIIYQSEDHSVAQMSVRLGLLDPADIRSSPDRCKLIQALGIAELRNLNVTELDSFDQMLLCSDGFWECVTEDEMLSALRQVSDAGDWLSQMRRIHSAHPASGNDNHTAVAVIKKENSHDLL